ncbi:MAG: hypothetical protein SGPRY_010329 [Prymnesium sp.]
MWPFKRKSSGSADPPPPTAEPSAPPPPPPIHFGVPLSPVCIAVDPIQSTIALGTSRGEVKLFSRANQEVLLPHPTNAPPVVHLFFWTNNGRLLSLHTPDLIQLWDLTGPAVRLCTSFHIGQPVDLASLIPSSPFALLASCRCIRAYDLRGEDSSLSPWQLPTGDSQPLCAMQSNPLDPRKLLTGSTRGRLRVHSLSESDDPRPTVFADHPAKAGLCTGCWLPYNNAHSQIVAGYDNGEVLIFSLRNPGTPNATLLVSPASDGPRRPIRHIWAPHPSSASPSPSAPSLPSLSAEPPSMIETVFVSGGSVCEEPDGLVLMRGAGLRERAMVAPFGESVVGIGLGGGGGDDLLLLCGSGRLLRHSLRHLGGAPSVFPPSRYVAGHPNAPKITRARLTLVARGAGTVSACVSVASALPPPSAHPTPAPDPPSTPHIDLNPSAPVDKSVDRSAAARALRLAREAAAAPTPPFFDESLRASQPDQGASSAAPPPAAERGLASAASRWLNDGLKWLAMEEKSADVDATTLLGPLFFPASPAVRLGSNGSGSEEANRAALLSSSRPSAKTACSGSRGGSNGSNGARALGGKANAAASAMHENVHAMHERGEKLNQLGDKTQKLADEADDFLNLAKQLRKQEEKPFFGLF